MFLRLRFWSVIGLTGLWCLLPVSAAVPADQTSPGDQKLLLLARLIRDPSQSVRVEALRALATVGTAEAAAIALEVADQPMDRTLEYALWLTINDLAEPWIAAVQSGEWRPAGRERQLEFALRALRPEQASRILGDVWGDGPLPRDGSGGWIEVIGSAGGPEHLRRLLDQAVARGFDEGATVRALRSLAEAARLRNVKPGGDLSDLAVFLRNDSQAVRLEAARLAGLWKQIGGALPVLLQLAGDPARSVEERSAAFGSLRQIGGEGVVTGLRELAEKSGDGSIRRAAAIALLAMDQTLAMPLVMESAKSLKTEREALEFWRGVLAIEQISPPLREALADQRFDEVVGRAGMRVAREGGRDDVELVAAFAKAGGLAVDTEELTGELIRELAARAAAEGDPHRGEAVYRREALACVTCHAIGGAGGKVGPDMTSIGTSAPLDYLVESLLLPNAKIKEGYHSIIIETRDGEEVTGTLSRETQDEVFLRNAAGEEIGIPKNNIERRETGRLSLMPSGLLESLTPQERLDLFAFLGQLGRPGEFDASRAGVARRWWIANVIHTDLQNQQEDWYWHRPLDDRRWVPTYSLVSGRLPGEAIEAAARAEAWTSKVAVVLVTEIEQAVAGPIRFRPTPADAELWVAGERLGSDHVANLPPGRHRVVVKLDPRRLPGEFRLEAEGGNFVLN